MKHFTETIPVTLAEKLKEKGMPITITEDIVDFCTENEHEELTTNAMYAEVFDWLMVEKEIYIRIIPFREVKEINGTVWAWSWFINRLTQPSVNSDNFWMNWHEAANAAIEKALELI